MMQTKWNWGLAAAASALLTGAATAQTVITQWNFNSASTSPSTGSGTLTLIGGVQEALSGAFASQTSDGASTDPNPGSAYNTSNYPLQTVSCPPGAPTSGTAGIEFAVSTAGFINVSVSYDVRASNSSSRHTRLQYSNNGGSTWIDGPAFTQTSTTWVDARTVDLSGDAAAGNNANFRFRIVTIYSPDAFVANSVSYDANCAYQPTSTGATQVYNGGQTDIFGSTMRYDMVTVRGDSLSPTPPVLSLPGSSPPAVCPNGVTLLTVTAAPGTNPVSTGVVVRVNLSSIGGASNQQMFDDGSNGDILPTDGIYSFSATVAGATTPGIKSLQVTATDDQSRNAVPLNISLGVGNCTGNANSSVVISQVYAGGGNLGASLNADFVELFNRSSAPVDVTGWSVQYASTGGVAGFTDLNGIVALSGTINPGKYVLVQMSNAGANGVALPTPDFAAAAAFSGMGSVAGRVALVSSTSALGTNYTDPSVKDFVGYGAGTITFEGAGSTANLGPDTAGFRKNNGCQDTNENFNDFETAIPAPRNSATPANACPATGPDCFNRGPVAAASGCSPAYTANSYTRPTNAGHFAVGGGNGTTDTNECISDWDGNGCVLPSDVAGFVTSAFYDFSNGTSDAQITCGGGPTVPATVASFVTRWFGALSNPAGDGCTP